MVPPLHIHADLIRQIEAEAAAAYPHECCGVLLGQDEPRRRIIASVRPLRNVAAEPRKRFAIRPSDLMRVERDADAQGLRVLGFYHSHPDHPAFPSQTDRLDAWPFYSYIIVTIAAGRAGGLACWQLDGAEQTFAQQDIVEYASARVAG